MRHADADFRRSQRRLGGARGTDETVTALVVRGLRLQGAAEQLALTDDLTNRLRYCRQIYEGVMRGVVENCGGFTWCRSWDNYQRVPKQPRHQ